MWELIQSNRRKSLILFFGMGALLILIGYVFGSFYNPESGGAVGVFFAIILWMILSTISYFAGSKILLAISGAKEVTKEVHPQLYNVVEEMKIAAGVPYFPKIFIIDDPAPNAFATGVKPENSAIAVTSGLLSTLNRYELQGVVAHEMSHIVNRDILLMTFAGMMLGAITLMSEVFFRGLYYGGGSRYRSKSSSKNSGQGQIIIMILALVLAILGPILAQLFYFAISRKREYLADASAARLTRYPEGLANALEKIANSSYKLRSANKVTAPMYIVNPLKREGMKLADLTSTHPPISERIKILRALQQGVSYKDYQKVFEMIYGKKEKIIPDSALKESIPVAPVMGLANSDKSFSPVDAKREANDAVMKLNNYKFINCKCGVRIKIPPDYNQPIVVCPRCGTRHQLG
ncbi:Heat shock protein HtpX [Ignavibacterium album JCM 16511]|uniref:Protease HtpX homolog n=1 Tax=Ignavibacterium album (strain DSM 19864 / JCM 16511 / NBRC 101810 / Mat9-16) TaxID=945713 RepID=I0AMC9_IGNAJ|nr:M48 family metallopeptidase [Ignavibacterium album]AFH50136.1 Heat shock protein HtpX [Ignavibacterium album JCM 16511]